jgi:hypothetical protein
MLSQAKNLAKRIPRALQEETRIEVKPIEMASIPPKRQSINKARYMLDCHGRFWIQRIMNTA